MNSIIGLLESGLDGASRRQEVLSNNIANVNTPDYKRKDVEFVEILKEKAGQKNSTDKLRQTNAKHFPGSSGKYDFPVSTEGGTSFKNDGNNVDIDVEMAEIAKNNIYYNTLTDQINGKFSKLKGVIERGGGN